MNDEIKSILVENFQAHRRLQLDFGKHITSITGPSDKGKSAIIRALVWVITNRPSGDSFIRYGAEECSVTVEIGNHTIQRIKGKKRNVYILDGVEFKALKSDVPEEIQKIFNINQNNIQNQFDPIFWFSSTAGEIGRNLNQIVNLDILDHVLGEIQSKSRHVRTELDIIDNMILEQNNLLKNADVVESALSAIQKINTFESELKKTEKEKLHLTETIGNINMLDRWLQQAENWENANSQLEALIDEYLQLKPRIERLSDTISNINILKKEIVKQEIPETLWQMIARIEEWEKALLELRKDWKRLKYALQDIAETDEAIKRFEKELQKCELELHKILETNICPLCGRKGSEK